MIILKSICNNDKDVIFHAQVFIFILISNMIPNTICTYKTIYKVKAATLASITKAVVQCLSP